MNHTVLDQREGNWQMHVGVVDVIATATIVVRKDGSMLVKLSDGVRDVELANEEAAQLYFRLRELFGPQVG